mmetsp:Transcript_14562/g.40161  ORF Transcript_14562/g.40161 Transcript_14562/m.40161 type:complete len:97 (+) Transcript_14562:172-462(+)
MNANIKHQASGTALFLFHAWENKSATSTNMSLTEEQVVDHAIIALYCEPVAFVVICQPFSSGALGCIAPASCPFIALGGEIKCRECIPRKHAGVGG